MKKIALLLFLIFGLVQVTPGIFSCCGQDAPVFIADEEKGAEKPDVEEKKEKKEPPAYLSGWNERNPCFNPGFLHSESILPYPCLEQQTPPPNEC
ncbi:MAG: hypothetical protein RJA57_264 [Bacteroidota bacterium]|jgi:hypothetical protein